MEYEFRSLQKAQQKHHNFMSNITQPNQVNLIQAPQSTTNTLPKIVYQQVQQKQLIIFRTIYKKMWA